MEPATVLVGALKVDIGHAIGRAVRTVADHESMGGAGVKPDVQNVRHQLPALTRALAKETLGGARLEPRIGALGAEGGCDAGIHGLVAQDFYVALLRHLDKAAQRHAPCALAGKHPVGAVFDHRIEAVAAGFWRPLHIVNLGQGALADGFAVLVHAVIQFLINRDKPLRRIAENDRGFGAPGVGVAVLNAASCDQRIGLDQLGDHRLVGLALLALAVKNLKASEKRHEVLKSGILVDVMRHPLRPAALHEALIVIGAVGGRGMHKACACVVGDVVAINHRHALGVVPERVEVGEGVFAGYIEQFFVVNVA